MAKASTQMDMTQGKLFSKMVVFTLPIIFSGVLQLLFNAADVMVVGQFAGAQSLAAVGSTGSLVNLFVNLFLGLSSGTGAVVARFYGAHEDLRVRRCVHSAMLLAAVCGLGLSVAGVLLCRPMLQLMGSPADVIDKASLYLRIYFCGMPAMLIYNFGASVLRAIGETRRPLWFLSLAGVINVGLNLVLVVVFHMDVAGVAVATVTSQVVSAFLVVRCLIKTDSCCHLDLHALGFYKEEMGEMLRLGIPAGIQSSLFSVGNVLIQSTINSYGSLAMAGMSASHNVDGFLYTAQNAFHHTASTFVAQNYGAKKPARIRRAMWMCQGMVTLVGVTLGVLMYVNGPALLGIYTTDPQVVAYGMVRLGLMSVTYFLCGNMEVFSGALRGLGYSVSPMIINLIFVCGFRVLWVNATELFVRPVASEFTSLWALMLCWPVSWVLTGGLCALLWATAARKKLKGLQEK